jgi:hypothetical protein
VETAIIAPPPERTDAAGLGNGAAGNRTPKEIHGKIPFGMDNA